MFKNAKLACFLNEAEILKFKEFQARREEIVAEFRAVEDKTNAMKKEVAETWEQIRKDYNLNARALQLDRENWTVLDMTEQFTRKGHLPDRRQVVAKISKEDAEFLTKTSDDLAQIRKEVKRKETAKLRAWGDMRRKYGFDNGLELLLDPVANELQQAIRDRDLAFVTYNECDPAWEGVCWHRYQEAEARAQALLREARRG